MRLPQLLRLGLEALLLMFLSAGILAPTAWAQVANPSGPPQLPQPGYPVERWLGDGASEIVQSDVVVLLLALLVLALLVAGSETLDRARDRRAEEAALLQARIANALLRNQRLTELTVAATVRLPLWRRSPATIELWGRVPTVDLWQTVLREAGKVASQVQAAPRLLDRITIDPFMTACAA